MRRSHCLRPTPALCLLLCLLLTACAGHRPIEVAIAHVNDTHSALEPTAERLRVRTPEGVEHVCRAPLGGMTRLKTALDAARAGTPNLLVLHAGDAVQGTLYFNVFGGAAEVDFLNALGFDAMVLGNHEFDRRPAHLAAMLAPARFPILAANVDASAEPELAARLKPYVIREIGGEKIAIVGLTTPVTPRITRDVGRVRFLDPAESLGKVMAELRAHDINKVVVLSHLGYAEDVALARKVPGIDVIVGGHSHSLLGDAADLGRLGLTPAGPYPTQVPGPDGPVLVVQAWKWGEVLGLLHVRFDTAGRVTGFTAAPRLVAGEAFMENGRTVDAASPEQAMLRRALAASGVVTFPAEDPAMLRKLAPYKARVAALQNAPIGARALVDLVRGTATDPGPILADACREAVPGAQLGLVGAGGVRHDIPAGPVTLGEVMAVSPFGNSLVVMDITGAQLETALEQAEEFRLTVRPPAEGDPRRLPVIHPSGFVYAIHPRRPFGHRIDGLLLRKADGTTTPMDPAATYRLVTDSFLAGGGDGLSELKTVTAGRADTGLLEHDALAEHLRRLVDVDAPADMREHGPRVRIEPR